MAKTAKEQLDDFIKTTNECFAFIDDPSLPLDIRAKLHEAYDEVLQKMLDEMSPDDYPYQGLEFPKLHKIGQLNTDPDRPKTCPIYDELRRMIPPWFRGDACEEGDNKDGLSGTVETTDEVSGENG